MKYIGFFEEMDTTLANHGSIKEYLVDDINYDRKKVVAYLKAGNDMAFAGKKIYDLITGDEIGDGFSIQTDGVFGWRSDLAYHVENYNIDLPKDFIMQVSIKAR